MIIDEAHRGMPEEGTHMRAVEAAFGADHTPVPFTATPKAENLLAHGLQLLGPAWVMFFADPTFS